MKHLYHKPEISPPIGKSAWTQYICTDGTRLTVVLDSRQYCDECNGWGRRNGRTCIHCNGCGLDSERISDCELEPIQSKQHEEKAKRDKAIIDAIMSDDNAEEEIEEAIPEEPEEPVVPVPTLLLSCPRCSRLAMDPTTKMCQLCGYIVKF